MNKSSTYLQLLLGVIVIVGVTSCANYRLQYVPSQHNWEMTYPTLDSEITNRMYLIGDCGGADFDSSEMSIFRLAPALAINPVSSDRTAVIFLGDNLYPVGMPPIGSPDRALSEQRLNTQVQAVSMFNGHIKVIPGNHGWYRYGREGLRRQEQYFESEIAADHPLHRDHDYFQPSNACGDITVTERNGVYIIALDSHWYIHMQDESDYSDCAVRNRTDFTDKLVSIFDQLVDKEIVLTVHHPIYTYGKHGGEYSFMQTMFPLTDVNKFFLLPLPIAGYIYTKSRPYINDQDVKNPTNIKFQEIIKSLVKKHGKTIVVSGHEHSLQYIYNDEVHYIVSGSGSEKTAVNLGVGSEFAYGNYGFAVLDYYADGSKWVHYYATEKEGLVEVFRKNWTNGIQSKFFTKSRS